MTIEARQAGETAKEYAYRIIKENIITLELEPGSTLNDMEISQMIGISRTPVREAIIKLKEESDIIEIFPQRGMRIALIDTDIVQEVRFLRMTLEKAMVELACDMAQEADFVWLEENLTLQEFYLKNNLIQKLLELDNALHRKLFSDLLLYPQNRLQQEIGKCRAEFDAFNNAALQSVLQKEPLRSQLSMEEALLQFRSFVHFLGIYIREDAASDAEQKANDLLQTMLYGLLAR